MSHMVIYRGSDGKPGYHQTDDIHDAVGFVEQMRNEQGVEHARIFRLEEVVFQYKPYYRVELAEGGAAVGEIEETSDHASTRSAGDGAKNVDTGSPAATTSTNGNGLLAEHGSTNGGDSESPSSDDDTADAGSKKGLFGR